MNQVHPYFQPRQEGEIDLVSKVREIMVSAGLGRNVEKYYDGDNHIREAQNKAAHVQRFLLNRYFNIQLMIPSAPSIEERYCLIPNGEISDWIRLFEQKVLPYLVTHNLPGEV